MRNIVRKYSQLSFEQKNCGGATANGDGATANGGERQ